MQKQFLFIIISSILVGCATVPKKNSDGNPTSDPPKLLKPVVRKVWMPPEILNGGQEWREGYYLYRIEKETTWSR